MATVRAVKRAEARRRVIVTPEGVALHVDLAERGSRFFALVLDLIILFGSLIVFTIILGLLGLNLISEVEGQGDNGAGEFLLVVWMITMFLLRQGYFMFFELGPRGATPGKRILHIRIAARDGGRLSAEAVIARNLLRDIELFVPLTMLLGLSGDSGLSGWAFAIWFLIFALFPFFNRDRLRAGDLIAGTWVIDAPRTKLADAMSVTEGAKGHSQATGMQYRFSDAELSVYGEHELQTLERVLREDREEAMVAVMDAICNKIGWQTGSGDERAFLEAYYAQLRARLEKGMRFGKRKADKFS